VPTVKNDPTKWKTRTRNISRASLREEAQSERPERISLRPRKGLRKGRLPSLSSKQWTSSNALYGVGYHMESIHMYEDRRNALDEFRDGPTELPGYGVARICDLAANRNQDFCAALGQAQRRLTIRLERSTRLSAPVAPRIASITRTLTISMASQIFNRMVPAVFNSGTGANCKRSTPIKSDSWPTLAAVPRAPPTASITRYGACVSVKLVEINGRTERVRMYPSACSMGSAAAGVKAPSPSDL
jgi:hypothetical protein